MEAGAAALAPELTWFQWLKRELAPTPGRGAMTFRIVVSVVLVVIISEALQVPEILLSAYMVLFVTKENKVVTTLMGVMCILGATFAIAVSILIYSFTVDRPEVRVPVMAAVLFLGFYFCSVFKIRNGRFRNRLRPLRQSKPRGDNTRSRGTRTGPSLAVGGDVLSDRADRRC